MVEWIIQWRGVLHNSTQTIQASLKTQALCCTSWPSQYFYAWRYKLLCLESEAINNIWTFCHDNFMTITFIFLFCSSHQHNLFKYWNIELWNINLGNLELRTVNYPAKIFTFPALNSNLFIMTWLSPCSPDRSGQYFIISC